MTDKKRKVKDSGLDELEDYARQIWLAGLGAYTRLGKEGSKLFETLIREGEDAEKLASKVSLDGARVRVEKARKKLTEKLSGWEERFDKRMQGTAGRMGLASQADLETLSKRVDELSSLVAKFSSAPVATVSGVKPPATRKPATTIADKAATAAAKKPATAAATSKATDTSTRAAPRRRSTTPKAATRGKTSPAPATDATPGIPPEL